MNPFVRYRLWKFARRAKPDVAFLARLETELRDHGAFVREPRRLPVWRLATAACAVVLAFGAGAGAYAYSSDEVLPDHPLYPVREYVEGMEERAALTAEARARVQRKHLERKLEEVRRLQERRSRLHDRLLDRVESVLEEGLEERRPPEEIRTDAIRVMRSVDEAELPERARVQLQRLRTRLESMNARLEAARDRRE